jgi:hypothetical protein
LKSGWIKDSTATANGKQRGCHLRVAAYLDPASRWAVNDSIKVMYTPPESGMISTMCWTFQSSRNQAIRQWMKHQQAPIFEDVFTAGQNQEQPSPYDYAAYDKTSAPLDAFGAPGGRAPQDYIEQPDQEFMGWPVLPEAQQEEEEERKSGRGGFFLRLALIVGLFGVVSFWGYYLFRDYLPFPRHKTKEAAVQKPEQEPPAEATDANKQPSTEPETQSSPTGQETKPDGGQPPQETSAQKQNEKEVVSLKPTEKTKSQPRGIVTAEEVQKIPRAETSNKGDLTVQVGSFKDQGEADARASSLNAATGGDFHVVKADIPGRGVWYRVQQVSGFASREAALKYGNGLRAKNLVSDFIVTSR